MNATIQKPTVLKIGRRGFLKAGAATAGGLMLGFYLPESSKLQAQDARGDAKLNAFVHVAPDDTVTSVSAQVGNGTRRGDLAVATAGRGVGVRLEQNPNPVRRGRSGLRPTNGHVRKHEHSNHLGTFAQGRRFGS